MAELLGRGIPDAEARLAEASHYFARIGPQRRAPVVDVLLVIMPAENGVVLSRFRQPCGDIRVVVEGNGVSVNGEFCKLPIQRDVRVL